MEPTEFIEPTEFRSTRCLEQNGLYYAMIEIGNGDMSFKIIFYRDTQMSEVMKYLDTAIDVVEHKKLLKLIGNPQKWDSKADISKADKSKMEADIVKRLMDGVNKKYLTRSIKINNNTYELPVFGVTKTLIEHRIFGQSQRYITHVLLRGIDVELGIFNNLVDAAEMYDKAVVVMNRQPDGLKKLLNYPEKIDTYKKGDDAVLEALQQAYTSSASSSSSVSSV